MASGSQMEGSKVTEIENEHETGSKQWKSLYEYSTCIL
jgi:hypothetical protein